MKCNNLFLQFLAKEVKFLDDSDLYDMYKTYMKRKVKAFEENKPLDYTKFIEITDVLKQEILRRCCYR